MADLLPLAKRHQSVQYLMGFLVPNPHLRGTQKYIAERIHLLALGLLDKVSDGEDTIAGLRKLIEFKDCLVRQSIADERQ